MWVVNAMPWPFHLRERDPVPIVQEAGWAPGRAGCVRNISTAAGFDSWTVHSVASRYTDWAITAPLCYIYTPRTAHSLRFRNTRAKKFEQLGIQCTYGQLYCRAEIQSPAYWNLTAPPPVISPNSILPQPLSHTVFNSSKEKFGKPFKKHNF